MTDPDDDSHPDHSRFCALLQEISFSDAYYAYCKSHSKRGPEIPLELQAAALNETGRTWRYNKKEKFFAWRDADAPKNCELGINLQLRDAQATWILVFGTPRGHLGGPFAGVALDVKHLEDPQYQHEPRYPTPDIANGHELRKVLAEGFALYEQMASALRAVTWK